MSRHYVLAGPAGSGKDHAAQQLCQVMTPAVILHMADPLYETLQLPAWQALIAHLTSTLSLPRTIIQRRLLQTVGDVWRSWDQQALAQYVIRRAATTSGVIIVPDVRLGDEITALRAAWPDLVLIYRERSEHQRQDALQRRDGAMLDDVAQHHSTEIEVIALRAQADVIWQNTGDAPALEILIHQLEGTKER
jgi:hypothetical protein